jgi:hypothetical protein
MNISKLCSEGYYISNVFPKSSMCLGGVKNGDILCSFDGLKIDNYGELYIEKLKVKFYIFDYMKYKKVGDEIKIKILRKENNEWKILEKNIILLPNTYFPIRDLHYQYEEIDYQIIGGMVIMNLTNNHIKWLEKQNLLYDLGKYKNIKDKLEPKLIITHIIKGSKLAEDNIFKAPLILKKVNNIEVNDLKSLRFALEKINRDNGIEYLSFLTENEKYLILGLNETSKEELFLSEKINYKLTDYTKKLLRIKK